MAPKNLTSLSTDFDILDEEFINEFGLLNLTLHDIIYDDDGSQEINDEEFSYASDPEIRYCFRCGGRRYDGGSTDFCRDCLWDIFEEEINNRADYSEDSEEDDIVESDSINNLDSIDNVQKE
jgi:hypothetical protein